MVFMMSLWLFQVEVSTHEFSIIFKKDAHPSFIDFLGFKFQRGFVKLNYVG